MIRKAVIAVVTVTGVSMLVLQQPEAVTSLQTSFETAIRLFQPESAKVSMIAHVEAPVVRQAELAAAAPEALDESVADAWWVNEAYPTLSLRIDEMSARRNGMSFNREEIRALMAEPAAWAEDDSIADELGLDTDERYDGRSFIRFNPTKLESLVAGDRMELPIPLLNRTYTFVVDQVEVHNDGDVTWTGHLNEFEGENQVSFTRGSTLTYAGITTPETQLVMSAVGDKGWIATGGQLFKTNDDHDGVVPGHDHDQEVHGDELAVNNGGFDTEAPMTN